MRKVNKPLSYVTTGQDVPDDIEVGKARRLAQLILGNNL
jgi:flagellar biosynthesis GTPase FlhF